MDPMGCVSFGLSPPRKLHHPISTIRLLQFFPTSWCLRTMPPSRNPFGSWLLQTSIQCWISPIGSIFRRRWMWDGSFVAQRDGSSRLCHNSFCSIQERLVKVAGQRAINKDPSTQRGRRPLRFSWNAANGVFWTSKSQAQLFVRSLMFHS